MSPAQHSPARLFITLLGLIFCIEGVLMLGLHYAFPAGIAVWAEALIDATLLTIFSSIFVWRLLMRPLAFALRSEAARARAVMDTAAEGIITIDERGIIESFNRAAEQMFGYEAGEALGKNVRMLVPEPHASAHDGYVARYLRTGEARFIGKTREVRALRKDGTEFPIEINLTEIRFAGGRYFTAIIRDVTERKQAEAERGQLAAIVQSSDDAIFSCELDRRITTWNAAAERLFGYTAAEIIGRNSSLIIPPDQEAQAAQNRALLACGQPIPTYDAVRLTKDGRRIDVSTTQSPIKDAGGKVIGVSLVFRDITERKQTEEEIRRIAHYDGLTGLPNRRLFRDRLVQAIALAKRNRHELALLYLDLDGFKAVNDTLGHDAGDELLKAAAGRIRHRLRESDTVARIGGDEFTVILPMIASRADVAKVAEKILGALSTSFSLSGRKEEPRVGVSIGIAVYPADARDMDALVKAADIAMYSAKRSKNTFHFFAATEAAPDERLGA
jgi:diguanylate cyclase (GGDEF)-like protein/PAS domain S-box-containing protein